MPHLFPKIKVSIRVLSTLSKRWLFVTVGFLPSFFESLLLLLLLLLSHFSCVRLCATLETAAHQAPLSLGFSRQEHWSGSPFPSPMRETEKWKWSRSVVSDPLRPHGLQPTRLLRPWDFPGKSTGVGCHRLLHLWVSRWWQLSCALKIWQYIFTKLF